jgi:hypothetical protein
VIGFGAVKVANLDDKSIPWRITANRMAVAFANWKVTTRNNPRAFASYNLITSLADTVMAAVLAPLEQPDSRGNPDVERVRAWIQQHPLKTTNRQLFNDSGEYRLNPRLQ